MCVRACSWGVVLIAGTKNNVEQDGRADTKDNSTQVCISERKLERSKRV
jgi:hypothetical protein